ncbi:hypothetical protein Acr_00g0047040 [Actinidia rufa]|uniref:Uncharacterized protein n=1 Tax=Actinidia rufa TaxID=165716 RepID=A0A7J0DJL7_9ERIC|nr:hypothetical protein Acr_00g0047040 [Actinidia rufa]
METEKLETFLRERQIEVEACKKEIEMQNTEREHLEKRINELLERCKNIDVEDYDRMREDVKQMQTTMSEKDAQLAETKKLLSSKQVTISELEQDLVRSRMELKERESRLNDSLQVEVSLKSEVEKQKKLVAQLKKKLDNLSKEKEELSKENQSLSKQLEDYKQGLRGIGDAVGEHAMKEKEKEKDTRIQILEKTVERQREELKKEKDDHKTEKAKRLKTEKTIMDSIKSVNQEKNKLVEGLDKHKQSLKRLSAEVEKLKHAKSSLPEGTSVVQILSGTLLDDLSASYLRAVECFERVAHIVSTELGDPSLTDISPVVDASSAGAAIGQAVPSQGPSTLPAVAYTSSVSSAKPIEEKERRFTLPKSNVEARRTGRKLIRPRIVKPEESQGDTEMPESEGQNNEGKPSSSHNLETQGILVPLTHTSARKRLASSTSSELQEESLTQRITNSDLAAPVLKKSKGSDFPQDGAEGQTAVLENLGTLPAIEELSDTIGDQLQVSNEEAIDAEKDDAETSGEHDEEPKIGDANQIELQNESNDALEEMACNQNESEVAFDDGQKVLAEQDIQQSTLESGSEQEEGELAPDVADVESGGNMSGIMESQEIGENQTQPAAPPVSSPLVDEETLVAVTVDFGETMPQFLNDEADMTEANAEVGDNSNDGNNQVTMEADQNPEPIGAAAEAGVSKLGSTSVAAETQEVKQGSPVGKSSTTINLQERAKQRSLLRQAGVISSLGRGRGRAARGGRGGRGQASGGQG